MKKIAVIGCGNLASAIVEGLYSKKTSFSFHTYTPSFHRAQELAQRVGGKSYQEFSQIPDCDIYMLGFKPQQLDEASLNLKRLIPENAIVLSLLAGKTIEDISKALDHKKVIRYMVNTSIRYQKGIILEQVSSDVKENEAQDLREEFSQIASVYEISDANLFNQAMIIAASGPAFIMSFAHEFSSYLSQNGMSESDAIKLVKDLFTGVSYYMQKEENSFLEMASKVTSKGGVTFEVLEEFKEKGLSSLFQRAFDRGVKRAKEL